MAKISDAVVQMDRSMEGAHHTAAEALARFRWHSTLNPEGPKHSFKDFAAAVGCSEATIERYANGYAAFLERRSNPKSGKALTIQEALCQPDTERSRDERRPRSTAGARSGAGTGAG